MENLSISDPQGPPGSQPMGGPGMPQPPPQLPPQMFTTAAQLLDLTDKKLILALRDGRKLVGVLRSWDQFANLVLQSTTERIYAQRPSQGASSLDDGRPAGGLYADISHGVYIVRGENVLLLGEIDLDRDDEPPPGYERAEVDLVKRLVAEKKAASKPREKKKLKNLANMGFEGENMGEVLF